MLAMGAGARAWLGAVGVLEGAWPLTSIKVVGLARACGVAAEPPPHLVLEEDSRRNLVESLQQGVWLGLPATIWKVRGGGGRGTTGSGTRGRCGGGVGALWGPWPAGN